MGASVIRMMLPMVLSASRASSAMCRVTGVSSSRWSGSTSTIVAFCLLPN